LPQVSPLPAPAPAALAYGPLDRCCTASPWAATRRWR
jgi:hypothetical protein